MLTLLQNLFNLSGTLKTSLVVGLVCFCLGVIAGVFFAKPTVVINKDKPPVVRDSPPDGASSPMSGGFGVSAT